MPTYLYRCKSCSHEFEELQKFSDEPLTICPSCKQPVLVRVIGSAGLVFKGSGFYLTDYKKNTASGSSSTEKESSETKSDTKPETKPETKSESTSEKKSSDSRNSKGKDNSES